MFWSILKKLLIFSGKALAASAKTIAEWSKSCEPRHFDSTRSRSINVFDHFELSRISGKTNYIAALQDLHRLPKCRKFNIPWEYGLAKGIWFICAKLICWKWKLTYKPVLPTDAKKNVKYSIIFYPKNCQCWHPLKQKKINYTFFSQYFQHVQASGK